MGDPARRELKNATFRVPRATWQRAKRRAIAEDRSLNDVIVQALEAYAGAEVNRADAVAELLAGARKVAAGQPRGKHAHRFTKDELHGRRS